MRTVVLAPASPDFDALIARRRELGLDGYDEVWGGEYHMAPMADSSHGRVQAQLAELLGPLGRRAGLTLSGPFNLGEQDDFRVPDLGLRRDVQHAVWIPTAAVVVEVESPGDETWEKLPFYAAREVDEVLIASLQRCSITWLVREADHYVEATYSRILGMESGALGDRIDWPRQPV